ncbi:energy transducer TonB [Granulicella rosea]|uniref:energy transducer TonB n=1 Tax=Granulicella rosea TaxID=474952 RepID=UPI00159539C1|nr:energy transducer TonB [Granulicella rosea]
MFLLPGLVSAQTSAPPALFGPPVAVPSREIGPNGEVIFKIGKETTPPEVITKPEPIFPEEARHAKVSGITTLMIIVDAQGVPQDVHVVHSLAEMVKPKKQDAARALDTAALEAVKQYRFKPAMRDGKPVAVKMYVEVDFQIRRKLF